MMTMKKEFLIVSNSGDLATYLPWREGQPNGGEDDNFVGLIPTGNASFLDVSERQLLCVSCKLSTTTRFKLRGLCKGTKLGKGDMTSFFSLGIIEPPCFLHPFANPYFTLP